MYINTNYVVYNGCKLGMLYSREQITRGVL